MECCAVCAQPICDQRPRWVTANKLVPAKLYCSSHCAKRAAYMRRRERASKVVAPLMETGGEVRTS